MKRQLLSMKGFRSLLGLLVILIGTAVVTGQNTTQFRPVHTYNAMPGHNSISPTHQFTPSAGARLQCDTDKLLDYSTFNEIDAIAHGIAYQGSWNGGSPAPYAQQLSALYTRPEVDSFHPYSYAGVIFDTLAFGDYTNNVNTSQALSVSTIYFDQLRFFGGLSGDSTKMANDSLVFTIFSVTGNNSTVVKTIVYRGMSQLRQFYLLPNYLGEYQIPVQYQFTQGQGFAVRVQYLNHDTSGHFLLSYSYPDSCNTIVYQGNTYNSPAHISSFPGTSFWGALKDTLVNSVVSDAQSNVFAYNLPGIPANCTFVYPQNWELIPVITVCRTVSSNVPTVVTNAASSVGSTSATLNGTVNANTLATLSGFQWGLTTAYTGGNVGGVPGTISGSVTTPFTYGLSGLSPNTTYHFRALGVNSAGTTYGNDLTFTTLASTQSGCDTLFNERTILDTAVILNLGPGNGFIAGNNLYGDFAKAEGFAGVIGDVVSSASLYFGHITYNLADANVPVKIMVWDNSGTSIQGFTGAPGNAIDSATVTLGQINTAVTNSALITVIFTHNVALTTDSFYVGVVLPTLAGDTIALVTNTENGGAGNGWEFEANYISGTGTGWGSYNNDWGAGGYFGNYIQAVICAPQSNPQSAPSVITTGASAVTTSSATLRGSVNANGNTTSSGFQWGLNTSYTGGTVAGTPASFAGSTYTPTTYALSGLTAGTTYHYRALGTNSYGTTYGRDTTFTTLSGSNVCTPAGGVTSGISPTASNVPCVTQGSAYTQTYTIVVPAGVNFGGTPLTITSITIDSIGNLPSGLTFMSNSNPATFAGGTTGCYIITGTTNSPCGTYLTPIYITAVTNAGTFHTTTTAAGYSNQYLQIITSPHLCPTLDTTQTVPFVSNPSCGITAAPSVTITPSAVHCFGQNSGSAVAVATGGNGTYTYAWSNGATTSTISNVISGTYSVTVTSNSQTATASATITQPASALLVTASATQTSCTSNSGTATAVATGGTTAYTYHWNNGATAASLTGLGAATLTVTVTDANGCSATASATVSNPPSFTVSTSATNVNCFGQSTGGANATTTGATGNLTYSWSNNTTAQSISNVAAGTYSVVVTETNGCSASASAVITQPVSALGATATSTITSCGSNTGSATVVATGGTTAYTYSWSNSGTTNIISNIGVGNYNVTVTDAKNCTATATTSVNTSATYSVNVTSTSVSCFGGNNGTATATLTGATGNITYAWSNGGTAQSISSLTTGNYNVTVTDGSGCAKTGSTTVAQPASALSASVTTTQTACSSNTGTATAVVTGGTIAYTYAWGNASSANPATGLAAGNINLTVTDSKGCSVTTSGTVTRPAAFSVTVNSTAVTCYGQSTGTVTASVSGSTNDTYFWSNGGTSSVISNVPAAQYTVTVTDGFGCSASALASVTQPASGVTATTSTISQTSCLTANGSATVTASNGASPYSYLWSNSGGNATISNLSAGNYTVTVTDNNHCTASAVASVNSPASFSIAVTTTNDACYGASTGSATVTVTGTGNYTYLWSNSITAATNSNLPAGTYNVTVTDANGCSKASSGTVTQPATALVANATATNSTCGTASGTASVTVVGGTGSPSYLWSTAASTSSITNLGVGVYTVTVTEGSCTATSSAIVNNLNGPTLSLLSTSPTCPGGSNGSVTAVASGGTRPYTYAWSNGQTGTSITGLTAGSYSIIVADSTGCQVAGSANLVAPSPIAFNPTIVNVLCQGGQNGSISLAVTGGTGPYSYTWSNGNSSSGFSGLAAGNVSITVTDSRQCSASSTLNVTQPSAIQVSTTTTDATNGANGTATASATGGTGAYTYSWPGGVSTATATGLAVGNYTVTVTDANNCSATAVATIIPTGINTVTANITDITMIPNPATDQVKVVVSLATAQTVEFRLLDITGKYIYTSHEATVQGSVTHQIDLGQYASGIYLVEITAGNEVVRKKLVVAK